MNNKIIFGLLMIFLVIGTSLAWSGAINTTPVIAPLNYGFNTTYNVSIADFNVTSIDHTDKVFEGYVPAVTSDNIRAVDFNISALIPQEYVTFCVYGQAINNGGTVNLSIMNNLSDTGVSMLGNTTASYHCKNLSSALFPTETTYRLGVKCNNCQDLPATANDIIFNLYADTSTLSGNSYYYTTVWTQQTTLDYSNYINISKYKSGTNVTVILPNTTVQYLANVPKNESCTNCNYNNYINTLEGNYTFCLNNSDVGACTINSTVLSTNAVDMDGDGFNATIDCNDNNATIRPLLNNSDNYINNNTVLCSNQDYDLGNYSIIINNSNIYFNGNNSNVYLDVWGGGIYHVESTNNTNISNININNGAYCTAIYYSENTTFDNVNCYNQTIETNYIYNSINTTYSNSISNGIPDVAFYINNSLYTTLDNISVNGTANTYNSNIIRHYDSNYTTINNSHFTNSASTIILLDGINEYFSLENSNLNTVFNDTNGGCLEVSPYGTSPSIINNVIHSCKYGIDIGVLNDYLTVSNNEVYNVFTGIDISNSDYSTVYNNTIYNTTADGLYYYGDNSNITYNNIHDTGNFGAEVSVGIFIVNGENTVVSYNTIYNTTYGVQVSTSYHAPPIKYKHNLTISNNNIYNTNKLTGFSTGIYLDIPPDWIPYTLNNTIVSYNNISNFELGLYINSILHYTKVYENNIFDNLYYNIYSYKSLEPSIYNNEIYNSEIGIELDQATYSNIYSNNIYNTVVTGIDMVLTSFSNVYSNTIYNQEYGIAMISTSLDNIESNEIYDSNTSIYMYQSQESEVIGNNVTSNVYSVLIEDSYNNNITANELNSSNNSIYLNNSYLNIVSENNVSNSLYGIYLAESENNTIKDNNFNNIDYSGIVISELSHYTNITGNIFTNSSALDLYNSLQILNSYDNLVYNNIFNSTMNAYSDSVSYWNTSKTLGTNIINGIYLAGNFWNDYAGVDTNGDGIGETQYNISDVGIDYLPLSNSVPQGFYIIKPIDNQRIVSDSYSILWNEASDIDGSANYSFYLYQDNAIVNTIVINLTSTSEYLWEIADIPNGAYDLKGIACNDYGCVEDNVPIIISEEIQLTTIVLIFGLLILFWFILKRS